MWTVGDRQLRTVLAALAIALSGCDTLNPCTPGQQRDCMQAFEGGFTQSGSQTCDARGAWSQCVGAGACAAGNGEALPAYSRCMDSSQCGPGECAVCNHYSGVQNPAGYSVCYPFCQTDVDCAPATPVTDVTARCVLGQCALLCHSTSTCPHDTACLGWSTATPSAMYTGFDGFCE